MRSNLIHVSSVASYSLRALEARTSHREVTAAKREAVELLEHAREAMGTINLCVTLYFDGIEYVNSGSGWKRSKEPTKCPRCNGEGIYTMMGGAGCFACGKVGKFAR